jgi:2-alkyl-3-oxoalkanoate reductase
MRVLITGASGFVGSAVVRAGLSHTGLRLRLATRSGAPAGPPCSASVEQVQIDLTDSGSIRGVCSGVDAVVHCASHIGSDQVACEQVNVWGTRALLAEARRAEVDRIVYLSTASVYGRGNFHKAEESKLELRPGSPTSKTRAEAERAVLAVGGTTLRPHLVYGRGDRWVGPAVSSLLQALNGDVEGWSALTSLIDVETLGEMLLATAICEAPQLRGRPFHANYPGPVMAKTLVDYFRSVAGLPAPLQDLALPAAQHLVRANAYDAHTLDMLSSDHWFCSDRIWQIIGCWPGNRPAASFSRGTTWYRGLLGAAECGFRTSETTTGKSSH